MREKNSRKKKSGWISKVLNAIGTAMILIVVLLCLLLVLPKALGFQMYHVLSGSMEPTLPVGCLIYVQAGIPEEVEAEDVIAFYVSSPEDSGIITHRVVANNVVSGTFETKGDANERQDPVPVPYGNYIGRVRLMIPYMGEVLTCMSSLYGRVAAVSFVLLGVLLNLIGSRKKG